MGKHLNIKKHLETYIVPKWCPNFHTRTRITEQLDDNGRVIGTTEDTLQFKGIFSMINKDEKIDGIGWVRRGDLILYATVDYDLAIHDKITRDGFKYEIIEKRNIGKDLEIDVFNVFVLRLREDA